MIHGTIGQVCNTDNGWQHITWPFLSQTNPSLAMDKFLANDTKVQKTDTANTYWFINSMKQLGVKQLTLLQQEIAQQQYITTRIQANTQQQFGILLTTQRL